MKQNNIVYNSPVLNMKHWTFRSFVFNFLNSEVRNRLSFWCVPWHHDILHYHHDGVCASMSAEMRNSLPLRDPYFFRKPCELQHYEIIETPDFSHNCSRLSKLRSKQLARVMRITSGLSLFDIKLHCKWTKAYLTFEVPLDCVQASSDYREPFLLSENH